LDAIAAIPERLAAPAEAALDGGEIREALEQGLLEEKPRCAGSGPGQGPSPRDVSATAAPQPGMRKRASS
jgi:hypothetical protein